jgi:GalNAc-alpha-(1->4)-GalNAc-alpha-(1->3)-diNAcBac-PP-undecaprenol alpha-1,4-N-acetyl-D-galactosaminyltransferase
MKILCIIDNLSTGGAQRQMINLSVGLHKRGHCVSIFCYAPGALLAHRLEKEGLNVHVHLKRSRFSLGVIPTLRRRIDQEKFQAVVSFLNTPNFYAILSCGLSKTRPAVIVSERFCDIPGYPSSVELAVRQLYRFSQKIVVNSHHQRINFLRRYPWMENRVVTIYNGYDLREYVRAEKALKNSQLNILVIASVSRHKNGLCLVRALDILRKKYGLIPRVSWVGERVMHGDRLKYLSAMEDEIKRLEISGQWQWLDQLHKHDVLVHPSYGEGLPNVVCEALACGRPVIVSNTLDHPNLVSDGVNGFLFDWRDPDDLARKIKSFDDLSVSERLSIGERGRDFAEKNLSLERYINDFERILCKEVK